MSIVGRVVVKRVSRHVILHGPRIVGVVNVVCKRHADGVAVVGRVHRHGMGRVGQPTQRREGRDEGGVTHRCCGGVEVKLGREVRRGGSEVESMFLLQSR